MQLFTLEKRFCPKTGKEIEPYCRQDYTKCICDYSGKEIDLEDNYYKPMYSIKLEYNSSSESIHEFDDNRVELGKIGVDWYKLMYFDYFFWVGDNGQDMSTNLLKEWHDNFKNKESLFFECVTLEEALRIARVRTVKKLLEEKKYTLEQLGILN